MASAVLVLASRRGSRRFLPPMAVAWVSGMLFSCNLFFTLHSDSALSPEHPVARILTTEAGIVVGVVMGIVLLLVLHDRRAAGLTAAVPEARRWPQPV